MTTFGKKPTVLILWIFSAMLLRFWWLDHQKVRSKFWGFHSGDDSSQGLLGCDIV